MNMIKKSLLILIFIICGRCIGLKSAQNSSIINALGSLNNQLEQLRSQQILSGLEAMKDYRLHEVSEQIGDDFKNYSNEILGYIFKNFKSLEAERLKFDNQEGALLKSFV